MSFETHDLVRTLKYKIGAKISDFSVFFSLLIADVLENVFDVFD